MKPIEHLSMYLPYNTPYTVDGKPHLKGLTLVTLNRFVDYSMIRLILKPLETITEEEFKEMCVDLGMIPSYIKTHIEYLLNGEIKQVRFSIIMELIKRHYDVFGLIQQGKAIDYQTLNK